VRVRVCVCVCGEECILRILTVHLPKHWRQCHLSAIVCIPMQLTEGYWQAQSSMFKVLYICDDWQSDPCWDDTFDLVWGQCNTLYDKVCTLLSFCITLHHVWAANMDKQKSKILPRVGFGFVRIHQSQDFDFVCV
jgi:hypothetical protein